MPRGCDFLDDELIASPRGIDLQMAAAEDLQPVVELEPHAGGRRSPHHGRELGPGVLKRQIAVSRLRPGQVGDLARHPQRRQRALDQFLDHVGQFGDGEDFRHSSPYLRSYRRRMPLVGRGM